MNQSAFYINDRINCHNIRVANAIRIVNFDIYRNDENSIDSNLDSLQIRVSVKRALQNVIVTVNNQFSKKKKTFQKHEKSIANWIITSSWFQYSFICFSTFWFRCYSFTKRQTRFETNCWTSETNDQTKTENRTIELKKRSWLNRKNTWKIERQWIRSNISIWYVFVQSINRININFEF